MSLTDYQKQVDGWVQQFNPAYFPIYEQLACLVEETGELARELNHKYGIKKKKASEKGGGLEEQLVEVLFTAICIANNEKINLDTAFQKMMQERHYQRDNKRFKKK